jgi:stage II sporulation protein AA (anti-sigma F factor antagonist)
MHYRLQDGRDRLVIAIEERFVFSDHQAFRDILEGLGETTGPSIVVDLSKLEFIDSAGLGMLLLLHDRAAELSRPLSMQGASGQVAQIFEMSAFGELVPLQQAA